MVFTEPAWSQRFADGKVDYVSVFGRDSGLIPDVAFFAYATPRVPADELAAPLRAAGIDVRLAGDCRAPRGLLAATADGHAAGNAL